MMRDRRLRAALPVEFKVLVGLGAISVALGVFLALGGNLAHGHVRSLDEQIMLAFRVAGDPADPVGPYWVEGLMRDITALGSRGILALVVAAVAGYLALAGRGRQALTVLAFTIVGSALGEIAKLGYARPRPQLVPHSVDVATLSFPSAHALQSSVVYLTLGAMLAKTQRSRCLKAYIIGVAVLLALMVGASRVYLGVHWPSDVAAGWALGTAWAIGCWLLDWHLRRRRLRRAGSEATLLRRPESDRRNRVRRGADGPRQVERRRRQEE